MMKCVFLGNWVMGRAVGLQRYTLQVLKALDRMIAQGQLEADIRLLIPGNAEWASPFEKIQVVKAGHIRNKVEKHLWPQLVFPYYVRKNRAIGIDMTNTVPVWGCDICSIPDCIPEAFPQFFPNGWFMRLQRIKNQWAMLRAHTKVITLTNDSLRQAERFYGNRDNRLSIVGCGWEHMDEIKEDDAIFEAFPQLEQKPYFFSLGSKYPHKDFAWVFRAAQKHPQYQFVITGTDLFSKTDGTEQMEKPENILFTGYISDGEIKALMKRCRALIQPSLCEGFGLPPIEALSLGRPVIVSNVSSLPEIYQQSAHYIDPYADGCDLDELLGQPVGAAAPVLQKYTWHNAAMQLLDVIAQCRS